MTAVDEQPTALLKAPTGIAGFDELTYGGLPRGRPTLVTGSAGSGKTLFGMEFLVRGAVEFGEPGVFLAFEELAEDLAVNVASLGFDLPGLERDGLLVVDAFRLDPTEYVETGAYDLEGLFIRLAGAVESIGAKRVVIDTIEVLFTALPNAGIVRGELGRLFRWLKERDLTVVITGERGDGDSLTRFGIEEYVSDCVVTLDHRITDEISTRRLRVVKYRGSLHGTNEYPFLITDRGIDVVPITSLGLAHSAPTERVSTGIEQLDHMLAGGIYRGSSTMISGSAGTGKTSIGAAVVDAACARGERALFVSMEESPAQLVRNMRSIGYDLQRWIDAGLLRIQSVPPTAFGFEEHLASLRRWVDDHDPTIVVLDAIASLVRAGTERRVGGLPRPRPAQGPGHHHRADHPLPRDLLGDQRDRHLLARRHLAAAAQRGEQRRAQPPAVREQEPRIGPLQPGPRVPAHRRRSGAGRRLRRGAGRADRVGPRRAHVTPPGHRGGPRRGEPPRLAGS